jgi:hypothetical protein
MRPILSAAFDVHISVLPIQGLTGYRPICLCGFSAGFTLACRSLPLRWTCSLVTVFSHGLTILPPVADCATVFACNLVNGTLYFARALRRN